MNDDITQLSGDLVVIDGVVLRRLNHDEFKAFTGFDDFQMAHPETQPDKFKYTIEPDGKRKFFDWLLRPLVAFKQYDRFQHIGCSLAPVVASTRYVDGAIFHSDGNVYVPLDSRMSQYVKPKVVCLCGSTRFYQEFQEANYSETMKGNIVLSVGFYPHSTEEHGHGEGVGHDSEQKLMLDDLHKRKIDLADEVLVINVGGYIGESTASEIEYAKLAGVHIRYLEEL